MATEQGPKREGWSARLGFLSAAIGSAVGLGNVWRFPNLSYTYGGGAFFIPFLLALFFIGIPLLTLEFGLGQVFRSGDVVSFGAMHKRLRGVGLGSVWCGFMVVTYYVLIIAWAITMLVSSFRHVGDDFLWSTGDGPVSFFLNKVVGLGDATDEDGKLNRSTKIVTQTWVGITFIWLAIYLCTFKGAKLTGRITYVTMTLPLLLLLILGIFFMTLEGAGDGIELYIGKWDLSQLGGSELKCGGGKKACQEAWPDAVAQVFFSLSITFGVMTAYASYNPIDQGVMMDATVTALGDLFSSFIAGFTVFAALGASAYGQATASATSSGVNGTILEVGEADIAGGSGGLGLVFWTLPGAFQAMGGEPFNMGIASRAFLSFLFYFAVVMLGVDSAFSLCEGVSTCAKDSRALQGIRQEVVIGVVCCIGYTISTIFYSVDVGLYMLDTCDFYINVLMLFVGFMECLSAGWVAYCNEQIEKIGMQSYAACFASFVLASILAPFIGLGIGENDNIAGLLVGLLVFFAVFTAGTVAAVLLSKTGPYDVLLMNVEMLRSKMNSACGAEAGNVSIPILWSLLIKFFIPPVLMIMLWLKIKSPSFGAYEGYPAYYQNWGLALIIIPLIMFIAGLVKPELYDRVMPENEMSLDAMFEAAKGTAKGGTTKEESL